MNLKFLILICNFTFCTLNFAFTCFAQDNDQLVSLSKRIIEADSSAGLYAPFEELKEFYFRDNRYNDFVNFLKSLGAKKKALAPFTQYYIALSRYTQLRYLEEKQGWDEYFAQGNAYRGELTAQAIAAVELTTSADALNLYARLLLWQLHHDQQDNFADESLLALMRAAEEYAKVNPDAAPIKAVADKLSSCAARENSSRLYKLYSEKLVSSGIKGELLNAIAADFFREGNLELAENLYDGYLARIAGDKDKAIPVLIDLARSFSYYIDEGPKDPFYAEKLFKKIEALGGKQVFDQELIYLRAFNLEKSKEYKQARELYGELARAYPDSAHYPEAIFKSGLISVYILGDIKEARAYFARLAGSEKEITPQAVAALYQLGLFSQWENDREQARKYFNLLLEKAKEGYPETIALTRQRLQEIEGGVPLEYNLRGFLDLALAPGGAPAKEHKIDISASPFRAVKGARLEIGSNVYSA